MKINLIKSEADYPRMGEWMFISVREDDVRMIETVYLTYLNIDKGKIEKVFMTKRNTVIKMEFVEYWFELTEIAEKDESKMAFIN